MTVKRKLANPVIVAPDYGAIKRARRIAETVRCDLAAVDKRRSPGSNAAEALNLLGDVKGRHCVVVDDMIDTGGTVLSAAALLRREGAISVRLAATHGVFSSDASKRLNDAADQGIIDEIIITDTIPLRKNVNIKCLSVVSLAPFFADVIRAITRAQSISDVYNKYAKKYVKN